MMNQLAQIGSGAAKVAASRSFRLSPGEDTPKAPRAFAEPVAFPHKLALYFLPILVITVFVTAPGVAAEGVPTFEEDVLPVFREKCCSCHNADKQAGGLDLTSYNRTMAGGSSGDVIAPGDAEGSYLWQLASHESEPKMPPQADRISDSMLAVITKWIAGGAIERKGGKPVAKKAAVSLALDPKAVLVPDGPPVVPPRLSLQVESHGRRPLAITGLAASPNGAVVAVGSRGQVLLYDTASLEFRGVLPFPEGDVRSLRFSRNAKLLIAGGGVGGKSGRAVIWDVASAKRVTELGDEYDEVLATDISADQRVVALGGPQKVVRLIRTADGEVDAEIKKHTDWITAVEFSPNGRMLVTGDRAGNAFLWETRGGREDAVLKGHGGGITSVAWRGDGEVIATASEDGKIRLWNRRSGEKMKEWQAHGGGVQGLCWLADGRLASCGRDKKVVLWKGDGGKERDFPSLGEIGLRVAVTSDRQRILAGDLAGSLVVFTVDKGELAGAVDTNPPRLEERLTVAEAAFNEIVAVEKSVAEKATATAVAMQVAESQVADAEKAVEEAKKALEAASAELEAVKAKQTAAAAQVERWKAELDFSTLLRQKD
jgi:WD40 repeat protein